MATTSDPFALNSSSLSSLAGTTAPSPITQATRPMSPGMPSAAPVTVSPNPVSTSRPMSPGQPGLPTSAPAPVSSTPTTPSNTPLTPSNPQVSTATLPAQANPLTPVNPTVGIGTLPAPVTPITPSNPNVQTATFTPPQASVTPAPTPAPSTATPTPVTTAPPAGTTATPAPLAPVNPQVTTATTAPVALNPDGTPVVPSQVTDTSTVPAFLSGLAGVAANMANGQPNPAYQAALNQAVSTLGTQNQAQMDAVKMQIESDPNLRGQGAGTALLSMMAAQTNSSVDQVIGSLTVQNLQNIQQMQQFGVSAGVQVAAAQQSYDEAQFQNAQQVLTTTFNQGQTLRQNNLDNISTMESSGDFAGAASSLNTYLNQAFPGENINISAAALQARDPNAAALFQNVQTSVAALMASGDYAGAATALSNGINAAYPGSNINIDPATLKANDPAATNLAMSNIAALTSAGNYGAAATAMQSYFTSQYPGTGITIDPAKLQAADPTFVTQFGDQMSTIKDIASTYPAAATAMLQTLMNNPASAAFIPAGSTAAQIISTLSANTAAGNLQNAQAIGTQINTMISSGGDFATAQTAIANLITMQGNDPVTLGQQLSLTQANAVRSSMGLSNLIQGANGTLENADGTPLTDADYTTLAEQNVWYGRQQENAKQPWTSILSTVMSTDQAQAILADPTDYPNGKNAITAAVQNWYLNNYTIDPTTGAPTQTGQGQLVLPWNDPKQSFQYFSWPTAAFDPKTGAAIGSVGNGVDLGGDAYGQTINGTPVTATPTDATLSNQYAAYLQATPTNALTQQQWYFATAGGTGAVNAANIPSYITAPAPASNLVSPATQQSLTNTFNSMDSTATKTYLQNSTNVASLVNNQVIPSITSASSVPSALTPAAISNALANNKGVIAINGKAFQLPPGATPVRVGTSDDPNKFSYVPMTDISSGKTIYVVTGASGSSVTKYPVGSYFSALPANATNVGAYGVYTIGNTTPLTTTSFDQIGT